MTGGVHFLDWRPHNRRAESLAEDLGARLWLAPDRLRKKALAPLRYGLLSLRMVRILLENRPDIVIASSPPTLCPIIAYGYARVSGGKFVIDAHHLATTGFWWWFPFGSAFNRFIMRGAVITLVHNQVIEGMARASGISAITLETKIPKLQAEQSAPSMTSKTIKVLTPCSFDPDEPLEAIYQAAASLPNHIFYVTGDLKRLDPRLQKTAPANLVLTGFLTQEEYDSLVMGCDVVLATTANDYPVRPRAATEALAAGKPLVASRNAATEDHLGDAALLIQNTAGDIVRALDEVQERYHHYAGAMNRLRETRLQHYQAGLKRLRDRLGLTNASLAGDPPPCSA